jgi:hypothetical protein
MKEGMFMGFISGNRMLSHEVVEHLVNKGRNVTLIQKMKILSYQQFNPGM